MIAFVVCLRFIRFKVVKLSVLMVGLFFSLSRLGDGVGCITAQPWLEPNGQSPTAKS